MWLALKVDVLGLRKVTQYCIIKQRRGGYVSMLPRRAPGVSVMVSIYRT